MTHHEAETLRLVEAALGQWMHGVLWRVLDRLLGDRELDTASALWQHILIAERLLRNVCPAHERGIYGAAGTWLLALDARKHDMADVRRRVQLGPDFGEYLDESHRRSTPYISPTNRDIP